MSGSSLINRLRGPKIMNMSIFDWTATFIVAVIISYVIYKKIDFMDIIKIFIVLIIIAILTHYFFGIPTMLNYYLGLNSLQSVLDARALSQKN